MGAARSQGRLAARVCSELTGGGRAARRSWPCFYDCKTMLKRDALPCGARCLRSHPTHTRRLCMYACPGIVKTKPASALQPSQRARAVWPWAAATAFFMGLFICIGSIPRRAAAVSAGHGCQSSRWCAVTGSLPGDNNWCEGGDRPHSTPPLFSPACWPPSHTISRTTFLNHLHRLSTLPTQPQVITKPCHCMSCHSSPGHMAADRGFHLLLRLLCAACCTSCAPERPSERQNGPMTF